MIARIKIEIHYDSGLDLFASMVDVERYDPHRPYKELEGYIRVGEEVLFIGTVENEKEFMKILVDHTGWPGNPHLDNCKNTWKDQ